MKKLFISALIVLGCAACRTGNRIEIINSQNVAVTMYQSDSPQTLSKEVPFEIGRGAKVTGTGL